MEKEFVYYLIDDKFLMLLKVPLELDQSIIKHILNICFEHCFAKINSIGWAVPNVVKKFEDQFVPSHFLNECKTYELSKIEFNDFDSDFLSLCSEDFLRQMFYLWEHRDDSEFGDCWNPGCERTVLWWLKKNYKTALKDACIKEVVA